MMNSYAGPEEDQYQLMRAHALLLSQQQRDNCMNMNMNTNIITTPSWQFHPTDEPSVKSSTSSKKKPSESFPDKLHRILEDAEMEGNTHIIGFFAQGRAFAVHDPDMFVKLLMPRYLTTARFSSFQRQLNLYGFRRIVERNISGFCHEHFLRGQKTLATLITRKKQRVPSGPGDDAATTRRLEERLHGHTGEDSSVISFGSASLGSASTNASSQRMSIADARKQLSDMRSFLATSRPTMPPPAPRSVPLPPTTPAVDHNSMYMYNMGIGTMGSGSINSIDLPSPTFNDTAEDDVQNMRALLQLQAQMFMGSSKQDGSNFDR